MLRDLTNILTIRHGKTLKIKSGTAASSGDNTLIAAVASKKLTVYALALTTTSTTAMTCKFTDGAAGTEMWSYLLQAPASIGVGANLSVSPPAYLFQGSTNTALILNLSSANTVRYSVAYWEE